MKLNKGAKPMRKRMLSAVLSLALLMALVPTVAYAASDKAISSANALYELGLFNGTGKDAQGNPNFDLDRTPTRYEAVTMLVRLLGRASEAEANKYTTPFTDVVAWASPYVGYAYTNKLTSGTSGTTFGGAGNATVSQYITFVLRALGYQSGVDFQWDKAWELSDKLGFTNGQYNASTTHFTRGDVVIISYNALSINLKGKNTTLLDDLTARGVIKEHTTPNNPDIAEDGHIHDWETDYVAEVGHYVNSGTHKVTYYRCDCGFSINSNDTNWVEVWKEHKSPLTGCRLNYTWWVEDVPNGDSQYVIDTPAHYETYCTICGATK